MDDREMKISVTKAMITAGARWSPGNCPLALGFGAAGFDVSVDLAHVDFYDTVSGVICGTLPLPPVAQRFQKAFDGRQPVVPFEFEMPGLVRGITPCTDSPSVAVV